MGADLNQTVNTSVLLTGATGFVGRQIHRALSTAGHDVRVVIRTGTAARLDVPGAEIRESPDLFAEDAGWWAQACAGRTCVIHAAWFVDPARYLAAPENLDCVRGTLALARGAVAAGVGHVVGLGTCFEYALPSHHLTFDAPLAPQSLYARCKADLFHILTDYFAGTGTQFSWARLFYLHCAGENPARLVPYLRSCLES
ncbi:MAG: NAD-dependent epimerase/dehydratase, partial [Rhizobiales bacterium 32-66-8]